MSKVRLSIIDGDFIPFYVCHNKVVNGEKQDKSLEDCKKLTDDLIKHINKAVNAEEMIGCLTVGKCFRYQVYPEYKANRKYKFDPKYQELMSGVKEYLITDYGFVYDKDRFEADDLVRIYKDIYTNISKGYEAIIVSPDKDILYLEGTHFNPKTNKRVVTSKEQASYYFWTSMICGDITDNIKGIIGIGLKGAEKLLSEASVDDYRAIVLQAYCKNYGEDVGIKEFYKNYRCLHMEDSANNINIPELFKCEVVSGI